jgi:hypothetical protein
MQTISAQEQDFLETPWEVCRPKPPAGYRIREPGERIEDGDFIWAKEYSFDIFHEIKTAYPGHFVEERDIIYYLHRV